MSKKIKLFCFPYAGGSSVIFHKWRAHVGPNVELVPVELAGRGKRINAPLYKDLNEAVVDVFELIKTDLTNSRYALFGHSLGCKICYGLAQKIRENDLPEPLHIFFSGSKAPHVKRIDEKQFHLMNDEDFKKEVIELGGTPPEFFEHKGLLDLFLPVLKNDFRIAEEDALIEEINPFDTNITVLLGKEDDLIPEECDGWKLHGKQICSIHYFEGGHFFLDDKYPVILLLIEQVLQQNLWVGEKKGEVV